jgi:hypothetical protein
MPIKKSVRLVNDTIKLCHELTLTGETNWSGSLNAMAEQYKLFVTECLPELCDAKKFVFYCAFNGYFPNPSIDEELQSLPWHISESYQYDEQVKMMLDKSGIDVHAFIEEIKAWSKPQKLAVIYMARAYWRQGQITG